MLRLIGALDAVLFTLENQDGANTMVYKFQESDDGTTWSDIELPLSGGGTSVQFSLLAGNVHSVRITSGSPRVRLMASGDLVAGLGLQYHLDTPNDTTAAEIFST